MANPRALVGVLALVIFAGGAAFYFSPNTATGLDAAGLSLLQRVEVERGREPPDTAACRALLLALLKHPESKTQADLIRGQSWLNLLLGRTDKAWDLVEPSLEIRDLPADQILGAQILKRRHADSGAVDQAHRAATLAEEHFAATGAVSSLFLAWQMALRAGDAEATKRLAGDFATAGPASPEARLVAALQGFPRQVKATRATLEGLIGSFAVIPEELELGLAWLELANEKTVGDGLERVERVLKNFPSSITGRLIGAAAASALKDWDRAGPWLAWLLEKHPHHQDAAIWRKLLAVVKAGKKGQVPAPVDPVKKN